MNPAHPNAQKLAAYKSGKLPELDATTIEAHLSSCDTCLEAFAKLPSADSLEKRLRGRRASVPTVDKPVRDWIDELGERNPLAKSSQTEADEFLKRLSPSKSPDELGRLGRYRVLKRIGRGGMGAVYLAHDTQLDRQVALKIPYFSADDGPRYLERFLREARAAATLDHPNICPVYDVGEINGVQFISMAYIEGKTLAEMIPDPVSRPKYLPERQVAAVIRELALALAEAHARGIVHRDLKPSNIIVNQRRKLVIMDFGLAGQVKLPQPGTERLTHSGMMIGTPAYMSLEQVTGDLKQMGPGCDIYSLGVIMYEMLTGRLPFEGPVAAILGQIMVVEPSPPSSLLPGLDPQLEAICMKAMSKKISDRHASMTELANALSAYLQPAKKQAKATSTSSKQRGPGGNFAGDPALQQFFDQLEKEREAESVAARKLIEAGRPSPRERAATIAPNAPPRRPKPAVARWLALIAGVLIIGGAYAIYEVVFHTHDGRIIVALQQHTPTTVAEFRKIEIKELPPTKPLIEIRNVALIETSLGTIEVELNEQKAPITVKNFLGYVDDRFYDGTVFHRVIRNSVVQGGGMEPGLKKKRSNDPIMNEASNGLSNLRGTIAMARTNDPDSATSQFFINVVDNPKFDKSGQGVGYCVFGKVIEGMGVVDKIVAVETETRGEHQYVPVTDVVIKSIRMK